MKPRQQRILELLDTIRKEIDNDTSEDTDARLTTQIQEMTSIQTMVLELEKNYVKMKTDYEAEIRRLKDELEKKTNSAQSSRPVSAATTTMDKSAKTSPALSSLDPATIPATHKQQGPDWIALSPPATPPVIKISLLHTFEQSSVVCCVRFSPSAKLLASGCNKVAILYDTKTGEKLSSLEVPAEADKSNAELYVRAVCFNASEDTLAIGAEDKIIRLWNISKPEEPVLTRTLAGHAQDIYSLCFFPSGDTSKLASGSGDRTVRIWNMNSPEEVTECVGEEVEGKDAGVTSVAVASGIIAAGSLDRVIRLWDTDTAKCSKQLIGHKDSVYSVAFNSDGTQVVSGSLDTTCRIWDIQSGKCKVFNGHKDYVLSVVFTEDDKYLVSGSKDRSVQFWDVNTGAALMILQGHKNSVISIAVGAGNLLATGSGDCRARIWRIEQA